MTFHYVGLFLVWFLLHVSICTLCMVSTVCIVEPTLFLLCREIKILKRLDHQNVIRFIETFKDPEKQKLYPLNNTYTPPHLSQTHTSYFTESYQVCLNIVRFLDCPLTYMVLEYCVGGLQEMLDKAPHNRFPPWQAHR